jgi:hypothetical protein
MTDLNASSAPPASKRQITPRALLLGERIDVAGLERSDVISTTPLAFRAGREGYAIVFRYGAVVLIGLSLIEEDELIRGLNNGATTDVPGRSSSSGHPRQRSCLLSAPQADLITSMARWWGPSRREDARRTRPRSHRRVRALGRFWSA